MRKLLLTLTLLSVAFAADAQIAKRLNPAKVSLAVLKGDTNDDGQVTVADVMLAVIHILGMQSDAFIAINADMNGDGDITIADVMKIVDFIVSGNSGGMDDVPQAYLTCPDGHHPHMIDLGLPSGTKWACCNVGAVTLEGYGGYYAWGETEEKNVYNDVSYLYATGVDDDNDGWYEDYHSETGFSGVWQNLGGDVSGSQYDVAHVKWGESWVMPSADQIQELMDNCTYVFTNLNGVVGGWFKGPHGGMIFLPSAGYRKGNGLSHAESYGDYWSSTPNPSSAGNAYCLFFNSDEAGQNHFYRGNGRSVRPVSVENTLRPLSLSMNSVYVNVGKTVAVEILMGNGSYKINCSATNIATTTLSGNTIVITGVAPGTAVVTVTDTRSGQTATIQVMVQEVGDIPQAYHSCPDNHHPHMIDLGLPSGTLWACCNVGATSPEGYGGYYAWGETEEKFCYDEETYPWFVRNSEWTYYYESLGDDIACTEHDVAFVKWGGVWRMPTQEDLSELFRNTTFTHDKMNGIYGGRLTGSNGAYIFMPAAGAKVGYDLNDVGEYGLYWTSTQFPPVYVTMYVNNCLCHAYHYQFGTEKNGYADHLDYYEGPRPGDAGGGSRKDGFSVRPVVNF